MTMLELVLGIVVVVMLARVLRDRHTAQATARQPPPDDPEAAWLRDEVRQLKERVQVLERVVTDGHGAAELDRQIGRLRDDRRNA